MPPKKGKYSKFRKSKYKSSLSASQKDAVQSLISKNIETKVIHHTLTTTMNTTPLYLNLMNAFIDAQGVTSSEFIGKEVRLQSLRCNGEVTKADPTNVVRVIVFRARGDFTPTAGNVQMFHSPTNPVYSELNSAYASDVKLDRLFFLNDSDPQKHVYKRIQFGNKKLLMKSIADSSQLWYLMYVSDSAVVAHPRISLNMTLRVKDA